jgi:hypothetical protein
MSGPNSLTQLTVHFISLNLRNDLNQCQLPHPMIQEALTMTLLLCSSSSHLSPPFRSPRLSHTPGSGDCEILEEWK